MNDRTFLWLILIVIGTYWLFKSLLNKEYIKGYKQAIDDLEQAYEKRKKELQHQSTVMNVIDQAANKKQNKMAKEILKKESLK